MKDSFRGHYPDGQLEPCGDRVSLTAVTNCGVREQAISMQRCFPPDRLIQGPDLVTQVIMPSLEELPDSGGTVEDSPLQNSVAFFVITLRIVFYLQLCVFIIHLNEI